MLRFRSFAFRGLGLSCLVIAANALEGCADTRGGAIPYNVSDFGTPDSPSAAMIDPNYKIAPMDTLTIRVFGMPDLSGDYQVDLLGNVPMPLIGDVAATDLTPAQLDALITKKYGEKYLQNPDVSVGVKSASGHILTIDGAVKSAGAFPVIGPMTLMRAIALAGGADEETANMRRVAVFRTIDGQREAAAFDLVSIQRGQTEDPPVYAGDIIIVDGSALKAAEKTIFQTIPLLRVFTPLGL